MASSGTPPALRLQEQDLASKVAVITGASRRIGRAIAINLATRGCSILGTCSSLETLPLVESLAEEISQIYATAATDVTPPKIIGIVVNIIDPGCPTIIADALEQHFNGRINIYVNNATITEMADIGALTPEHIQTYCMGNIQNPALIVDEMVKRKMFERDSRIVSLSSVRARKPGRMTPIYSTMKAAGEGLVRCWAEAFGGKDPAFAFMAGTTANSLLVGLTRTDAILRHAQQLSRQFRRSTCR